MGLVTGSSNAATCALAAARNTLLGRLGYDIAKDGLRNAPPVRIVLGEDAHKTLKVGYDCGIVLCRHRDALVAALQASGSYIQYGDRRDGMLYTTEMSRRARAVPLWALPKCLGAKGVDPLIDPVFFNQFMVACDTEAVLRAIQESEPWRSGRRR